MPLSQDGYWFTGADLPGETLDPTQVSGAAEAVGAEPQSTEHTDYCGGPRSHGASTFTLVSNLFNLNPHFV